MSMVHFVGGAFFASLAWWFYYAFLITPKCVCGRMAWSTHDVFCSVCGERLKKPRIVFGVFPWRMDWK